MRRQADPGDPVAAVTERRPASQARPGIGCLRGYLLVGQVQGHHQAAASPGDLVAEVLVGQVEHMASGPVQPRVPPPQADEVLVQPVGGPAIRRQVRGSGGERGADGVISPGPVLLDARKACSSP